LPRPLRVLQLSQPTIFVLDMFNDSFRDRQASWRLLHDGAFLSILCGAKLIRNHCANELRPIA
jgi:hypothetical protein